MPIEIERKFLVISDAWRSAATEAVPMRHGYLAPPGGRASIRVRVEGPVGKLNVKQAAAGISRAEYEYTIPADEAAEMIDALCEGLIVKTRYYVPCDGHVWEVDEFAGDNAGLVVAEIELASEDECFTRPPWLGAEVTLDIRYYNQQLARHPFQDWQ